MKRIRQTLLPLLALCALLVLRTVVAPPADTPDSGEIPAYSGEAWTEVSGNQPDFDQSELTTSSFETYSALDALGRCGAAYACVGLDLMPTEPRGEIGMVRPSGWQTVRYDGVVDGNYLYNRCHLIGYQLSGENANERNLITGTRYLNIKGMLPFENQVADYVQETGNHVLYRVTPDFREEELVARGVWMEALSVEDGGQGVCFSVYAYNVQPGVTIDYATGESWLTEEGPGEAAGSASFTYILNTHTRKFHDPTCSGVSGMKEENKETYTGNREDLIAQGYEPCGQCRP